MFPNTLRPLLLFAVSLALLAIGCDTTPSTQVDIKPNVRPSFFTDMIPESGNSPLPNIPKLSYLKSTYSYTTNEVSDQPPNADWKVLEPLLRSVQNHLNNKYVALYSVLRPNGQYQYQPTPLLFSDRAISDANGKIRPYLPQSVFPSGVPE